MPVQLVDFRLYLITDRKLFASADGLIQAVAAALSAGVKAVQLREKDLPTRELLEMAYRFRELTRRYNAKLFINDRLDIALSVEADGIHLGQSSIPLRVVRGIVNKEMMIGYSTHSIKEAIQAQEEGADFITFGPLFKTASKLKYGDPVGLEALCDISQKISLPIFGIGGIKSNSISDVLKAGASGIALISGILSVVPGADVTIPAIEYLTKAGERR